MWGPDGMMGWGWGWMGFGVLPMLLFWVLVAAGVALLVRGLFSRSSSRDILEQRYARDDLTRDEFLKMKGDFEA